MSYVDPRLQEMAAALDQSRHGSTRAARNPSVPWGGQVKGHASPMRARNVSTSLARDPQGDAPASPLSQAVMASKVATKQSVEFLMRSTEYKAYTRHADRYNNLMYYAIFSAVVAIVATYADVIATLVVHNTLTLSRLGTVVEILPHPWRAVVAWSAAAFAFPSAWLVPWSSVLFEVDDGAKAWRVVLVQILAAACTCWLPILKAPSVLLKGTTPITLVAGTMQLLPPILVGWLYWRWRSQFWRRAIAFRSVPIWAIGPVFAALTFVLWSLFTYGSLTPIRAQTSEASHGRRIFAAFQQPDAVFTHELWAVALTYHWITHLFTLINIIF